MQNNITAQDIRNALIGVAGFYGRPEYDPVIVRDVINAFRNNSIHALKDDVIRELKLNAFTDVIAPNLKLKKLHKSNAVKVDALNHGTLTKYNLGCRCDLCVVWG